MAEKAAMSALAMSQYKELQASIGAGIDPTPAAPLPDCVVRDATPEDVTAAASIVYTAFRQMADRHAVFNFTSQSLEHATSIVASCVDRKDVVTKVATAGDEILGFVASTPIGFGGGHEIYDLGPIAHESISELSLRGSDDLPTKSVVLITSPLSRRRRRRSRRL